MQQVIFLTTAEESWLARFLGKAISSTSSQLQISSTRMHQHGAKGAILDRTGMKIAVGAFVRIALQIVSRGR